MLDNLKRVLQNSTLLNGSELGGGHSPPLGSSPLPDPGITERTQRGGKEDPYESTDSISKRQFCYASSPLCLPPLSPERLNPVALKCTARRETYVKRSNLERGTKSRTISRISCGLLDFSHTRRLFVLTPERLLDHSVSRS